MEHPQRSQSSGQSPLITKVHHRSCLCLLADDHFTPTAPKASGNPATPSAITIVNQPTYPTGLPPTPVCSPNQTTANPISIIQHGEPSSSSSAVSWASDHFNLCQPSNVDHTFDNTATITKASIKRGISLSAKPFETAFESPASYHHPPLPFRGNMSSAGSSAGVNQQSSDTSFATSQPSQQLHPHTTIPALMSSSEEDNEPDDAAPPPPRRATCGPNSHDLLQKPADNLAAPQLPVPERKISLPEAGKTISKPPSFPFILSSPPPSDLAFVFVLCSSRVSH
jgi:hypothetical protein